jgi:hypothetical protein
MNLVVIVITQQVVGQYMDAPSPPHKVEAMENLWELPWFPAGRKQIRLLCSTLATRAFTLCRRLIRSPTTGPDENEHGDVSGSKEEGVHETHRRTHNHTASQQGTQMRAIA